MGDPPQDRRAVNALVARYKGSVGGARRGSADGQAAHYPPESIRRGFFVLLGCWVLIPLAIHTNLAQDALPFVVAGQLVEDDPSSIYTPSGDLFAPPPVFFERSCELAPDGTDCADLIVSFVSPPLALPVSVVLRALGPNGGVLLLRVLAAASLAGGMFVLWQRLAPCSARAGHFLLVTAVLLTPFIMVPISLGQTSPLLFLSAALGVSGTRRNTRAALVAAIFVCCVVFKLSPILLLPVVVWLRRWRLLAWIGVGLVATILITLVSMPNSLWGDFMEATRSLPAANIDNPHNGAVDAVLQDAVPFVADSTAGSSVFLVIRFALAGLLFAFMSRRGDDDALWSYSWLILVFFLPVVWWHYLLVTIPAIAYAWRAGPKDDRWINALPVAAAFSVPISVLIARGYALPVLQALFLVAALVVVPVIVWAGTRRQLEPVLRSDHVVDDRQ